MRWREITPKVGSIARESGLWSCVAVIVINLNLGACFGPAIERCAVQCGAQDLCPSGTTCLSDGMCHASENESLCSAVSLDASPQPDSTVSLDAMRVDAMHAQPTLVANVATV